MYSTRRRRNRIFLLNRHSQRLLSFVSALILQLVLPILEILVAIQQVVVLTLLWMLRASRTSEYIRRYRSLLLAKAEKRESDVRSYFEESSRDIWRSRWKTVFIWQCSMMFMFYSMCFFLARLILYVCTPLIHDAQWSESVNVSQWCFLFNLLVEEETDFNDLSKIAIVYLAVVAIVESAFLICAFWIYHYIDLNSISWNEMILIWRLCEIYSSSVCHQFINGLVSFRVISFHMKTLLWCFFRTWCSWDISLMTTLFSICCWWDKTSMRTFIAEICSSLSM